MNMKLKGQRGKDAPDNFAAKKKKLPLPFPLRRRSRLPRLPRANDIVKSEPDEESQRQSSNLTLLTRILTTEDQDQYQEVPVPVAPVAPVA
jgi:hypothetical protein